jgi:hypothetical protein
VLILVICKLVFTVFCIVRTVFLVLFRLCIYLLVLSVLPPSDNLIAVSSSNNNNNNNNINIDVRIHTSQLRVLGVGIGP